MTKNGQLIIFYIIKTLMILESILAKVFQATIMVMEF